jgi:hypothetical protein
VNGAMSDGCCAEPELPKGETEMRVPFSIFGVALIGFSSIGHADDIQTHVTYVCNGEHLFVESCNVRDLSDNSTCMVAHPDKMRPNGFPTYTNETRGTLKKLLPTCQQPSAQSVARVQAAQKKANDAYNAAVNPPKPPVRAAVEVPQNAQQNSMSNLNLSPVLGNSLTEGRCVVSGRNPNLCGENELGSWFEGAIANGVSMANAIQPGSAHQLAKATNKLPPDLEISGNYTGAGNWVLQFDDRSAMTSCGSLAPQQRFYKIEIANGQFAIKVEMTPNPLVLRLHPDGTLADAGPMVSMEWSLPGLPLEATLTGNGLLQRRPPIKCSRRRRRSNIGTIPTCITTAANTWT